VYDFQKKQRKKLHKKVHSKEKKPLIQGLFVLVSFQDTGMIKKRRLPPQKYGRLSRWLASRYSLFLHQTRFRCIAHRARSAGLPHAGPRRVSSRFLQTQNRHPFGCLFWFVSISLKCNFLKVLIFQCF